MRRRATPTLVLLATILVLPAVAGAQVFTDVEDRQLSLVAGETAGTTVLLDNPANRSYLVRGTSVANLSEATELTPTRFGLPARSNATVDVTIHPPEDTEFRRGDLTLRFTLIDRETGEELTRRVRVSMTLDEPALYLGFLENPLPEPYATDTWLFTLEIASWVAISIGLAAILGFLVNTVVPRASDAVQNVMKGKVRAPVFLLPIILGANYSIRLLPRTPLVETVDSFVSAISILIVGVAAYRGLSAILYYYGRNIAGRTETKVDDVLVPVLEKLGAALIVAVAGFYAFRALGVDFSFLVAGGLVAGLVISMAAQDTLSNFFSGLHILIDRPFREGDVIQLESGEVCRINEIGLRSTNLYHFQRHQEIIAPNNELAQKRIVNMTYPDRHYRISLPVSVAYGTDLDEAVRVVHNVAMEVEETLTGKTTQPRVFVKEFGESGIQLELRCYVPDERDRNPALTKLHVAIKQAFQEADITIPFPQRVLHRGGQAGDRAPQVGPEALDLREGEETD